MPDVLWVVCAFLVAGTLPLFACMLGGHGAAGVRQYRENFQKRNLTASHGVDNSEMPGNFAVPHLVINLGAVPLLLLREVHDGLLPVVHQQQRGRLRRAVEQQREVAALPGGDEAARLVVHAHEAAVHAHARAALPHLRAATHGAAARASG